MYGFGRREFQLMLLRRMADFQPELVADAVAEMVATPAEQRAAHHRWQQLLHSPRFDQGVVGLRAALGAPELDRTHDTGVARVREQRWRMPHLWGGDLCWCSLSAESGQILNAELVRDPPSPATPGQTSPLPEPWSLVVADIAPYVRHTRDDPMTSRTILWVPRDDGTLTLTFVWGLLQTAGLRES